MIQHKTQKTKRRYKTDAEILTRLEVELQGIVDRTLARIRMIEAREAGA
jgi:hypothetical protein